METDGGTDPQGTGEPSTSPEPDAAAAPASPGSGPDEPVEVTELVAAPLPAADHDAHRSRTVSLVAGAVAAVVVLLVGVVVLAGRGQSVIATVDAAAAIPATTLPPLEVTTTTEAVVAAAAEEPTPTDAPSTTTAETNRSGTQQQVQINLTRPSTVLQGKTVGQIPIFNAPGGGAVRMTLPHPRAINGDPNASVPLILLQKQAQGDWIEVYLPVRPNGSTGWVRRSDFTTSTHDYVIEVRLSQFNLRVLNGNQVIMNTSIGVATDSAPTPGGLYYTIELLAPPDPSGPYGPYAYGLSGYSNVYQSFGGGPGQLGLHGTNQPGALGRKVSHGCIRLSNQDITTLAKLLPLGVPVLVYY